MKGLEVQFSVAMSGRQNSCWVQWKSLRYCFSSNIHDFLQEYSK